MTLSVFSFDDLMPEWLNTPREQAPESISGSQPSISNSTDNFRLTYLLGVVKALGYTCVSVAALFLLYAASTCWFFRDGLGPDSVTSSGGLAWSRFFEDFRFAFLIGAPILLFGLWCIFRGRRVTDERTNA